MIHTDPFSGNPAIGYTRLNMPNGQKIIWESGGVLGSDAMVGHSRIGKWRGFSR
jgi:hypothetical protein